MDYLKTAKVFAERAETIGHSDTAHLKAQVATAYALISIAESLRYFNDKDDDRAATWAAWYDSNLPSPPA